MGANWRCCCEMEFDEKGSLELHQKEECTQAQIYMEREALLVGREGLRAEVVELKREHHRLKDGFDANMKHLVQRTRERDSALLQNGVFRGALEKISDFRAMVQEEIKFGEHDYYHGQDSMDIADDALKHNTNDSCTHLPKEKGGAIITDCQGCGEEWVNCKCPLSADI